MTERLSIRPAEERDREFIGGLVSSLMEFGSPTWDDPGANAPAYREALADAVRGQGPEATVLLAEAADGTRLGFISLGVVNDVAGAARGHVRDLAVTAEARRTGVGSALMTAAEAWTRDRGLPALSLNVWSTNEPAQAFYRRLGYCAERVCMVKRIT